jgi:NADH dehydrogenase/NADH:ubiquinone oxidoreductase subunit G
VDVALRIDDAEVRAPAGASLLDVARDAGCDIPALCHHEAVPPIAACRLCLVEVRRPGRGEAALTTSCDYPVSAGLEVVTDSALIRRHRAMNLQLLLPHAPAAPALQQLAARLGVRDLLFPAVTDALLPGCILCELCVRVCATLGYDALSTSGRGDHKSVGPPFGQTAAMACVGCGSCQAVCPTQCISMVDSATTRTIWGRTFDLSTCRRCQAPLMTDAHRAATAERGELSAKYSDLCEACKRSMLAEDLLSGARAAR